MMRLSTAFILLFLLVWTAASVWAAVAVFDAVRAEGAIEVRVSGDDGRVALDIPAFLVVGALRHATWIDDHGTAWGRHDTARWAPAVRAALTELRAYDDVPLFEADEGGSRVRIHKHGGRFVLEVDDGRDSVRVAMPARVLRRAFERA